MQKVNIFKSKKVFKNQLVYGIFLHQSINSLYIIAFATFDLVSSLERVYNENTCSRKHTRMIRAALFKIFKTWKQPKYPSVDERINKRWYTDTTEYYFQP